MKTEVAPYEAITTAEQLFNMIEGIVSTCFLGRTHALKYLIGLHDKQHPEEKIRVRYDGSELTVTYLPALTGADFWREGEEGARLAGEIHARLKDNGVKVWQV